MASSASFDVRFSMLDPPSLLNSIKDTLGLSVSLSSEDRRRERIKNLDRWWYCVDMLLWSTGAYGAEVVFAKEERFSISATLKLQLPNRSTTATLSMARDSWRDPFTWSISAGNRSSEVPWLHNVSRIHVMHIETGKPLVLSHCNIRTSRVQNKKQRTSKNTIDGCCVSLSFIVLYLIYHQLP